MFNLSKEHSIVIGAVAVLLFYGCCNELPQTWRLKQHTFIFFQFWRLKFQNSFHWADLKVLAGLCSPWRPQETGNPLALQLLAAADTPWLVASVLWSLPPGHVIFPSVHCPITLCLFFIRIPLFAFRAHPDNFPISRTLITHAKSFFFFHVR